MVDAQLNVLYVSLLPGIAAGPAVPADRRMNSSSPSLGKASFAAKSTAVGS
jgi:hypothetical protein